MKNAFFTLVVLALAALALSSCQIFSITRQVVL